jgi:hypothetical protein
VNILQLLQRTREDGSQPIQRRVKSICGLLVSMFDTITARQASPAAAHAAKISPHRHR